MLTVKICYIITVLILNEDVIISSFTMKKLFGFVLPVVLLVGISVVTLPGCSGGSGGSSLPDVSRFAGNYSGEFTGTFQTGPQEGTQTGGTFTATIDANGDISGSINRQDLGRFQELAR
jgi:hypothetical protein